MENIVLKDSTKLNSVIYKYDLSHKVNKIKMPPYASILDLQVQNGIPHIWAQRAIVSDYPDVIRTFVILGTGEEFNDEGMWYVGTYQVNGYVWHVMESELEN